MKKIIILPVFLIFLLCFLNICGCSNHTDLVEVKDKKNPKGNERTDNESGEQEEIESESEACDDSEKKLTLMIYMAADNDLESYALQNMKMMEEEITESINVIVLLDRSEAYDETNGNWTDTRIFKVCKDEENTGLIVSERISSIGLGLSVEENTELDMANPFVLKRFIEFVKSDYKAERYVLIIWGHGTGWRFASGPQSQTEPDKAFLQTRAVAIDDKTASYMTVSELGSAIRDEGIDVIAFDTCFGGVFENVYELKDCAEYIVACPGLVPGIGWNYKELMKKISQMSFSDSAQIDTKEIADAIARSSNVQTTVFISKKMDLLMTAFEDFSKALSDSITNENTRKNVLDSLLTTKTYSYFQYPCDLYVDFLEMTNLYLDSSDAKIKEAAKKLKIKIEDSAYCLNDLYDKKAGIGIHLIPLISAHSTAASHSPEYIKNPNLTNQGKFVKESLWWVPTLQGKSGSLLDKLFYTSY